MKDVTFEEIEELNAYIKELEIIYQNMSTKHRQLRHELESVAKTLGNISLEYQAISELEHLAANSKRASNFYDPGRQKHPNAKIQQTTSHLS